MIAHTTSDLQRHADHADILREQIDGSVGLPPDHSNLPDASGWPAHCARLIRIANLFSG